MARLTTIDQLDIITSQSKDGYSPLQPVSDALGRIFISDHEQSRIQKARNIMGDLVATLADEELETYMAEFQHLIDEWLDDFECQAFDGQTLRQVLSQE